MKRDLVKEFGYEEVKQVIMNLKENSAPGPNGFGPGFFKKSWELGHILSRIILHVPRFS